MQISKIKIKWMRSLQLKKNRESTSIFVAEGKKMVLDLLPFFDCVCCFVGRELYKETVAIAQHVDEYVLVDDLSEFKYISNLKTPSNIIAVFKQKKFKLPLVKDLKNELCMALDTVQDPGNMGTILRLADWFGIKEIFCSRETVDIYSPKCVQSTMGALSRVRVHYLDLADWLSELNRNEIPIYGTFLDGENIYNKKISKNGIIVMGNEGNGVSENVSQFINERLFIPNFPSGSQTSESLNVAVATGIICSEFRRR